MMVDLGSKRAGSGLLPIGVVAVTAIVAMAMLAPTAAGLGITIVGVSSTGSSTTLLEGGDRITFDLVIDNRDQAEVFALGIVAYGYDSDRNGSADNGLRFVTGQLAQTLFSQAVVGGQPVGGLGLPSPGVLPRELPSLFEDGIDPVSGLPTGRFVRSISGVAVRPTTGTGALDIGVDGRLIRDGDVHLRLTFEADEVVSASELTLEFGLGDPDADRSRPQLGEVALASTTPGGRPQHVPFDNATWSLRVAATTEPMPEPGAALLFAVGLGVLGASARRPSRT